MGEQNLARGSHLLGLEREDKSQDSGAGAEVAVVMAVVASGVVAVAGEAASPALASTRVNGKQVRGLVVGTGVEVNLENLFLSSLDGPRAREAGQEVFKKSTC